MDLRLLLSPVVLGVQAGGVCQEVCRNNWEMGLSYKPGLELVGKVISSLAVSL